MSSHSSDYKGSQYDFSDIRKHGAGIWFSFHAMTSGESTVEERRLMCKRIRRTAEIFKCGECRGHFLEYIRANPPEDTIGTPGGLFYWTVEFRNAVQRRIMREKNIQLPIYDPQIMHEIFHDMEAGVCDEDCGGEPRQQSTSVNTRQTTQAPQPQSNSSTLRYNPDEYIQIISRNGTVQWMPRPRHSSSRSDGFSLYGR